MEEKTKSRTFYPVLVKKGEPLPENVIPMTETEVIDFQNKRIEAFQPQKTIRALNYGSVYLGVTASVGALVINRIFRTNFRLGGLKLGLSALVPVLLPAALSCTVHELFIKQRVLLGMDTCPVCLTLTSGLVQAGISTGYSYFMSFVCCLPVAREFYTLPMPPAPKGQGHLRLLLQVSPKSSLLLTVGLANMLAGFLVTHRQIELYIKYFSQPPSQSSFSLDNHTL